MATVRGSPTASAQFNGPLEPDAAWRALHKAAYAPYRQAGLFAWFFARGKLGRDPMFRGAIERGDLSPMAGRSSVRVLDIGCGQGLLASLLIAIDAQYAGGAWPASWPEPPLRARYIGIELMRRDIERAQTALSQTESRGSTPAPSFIEADMREAALPASDLVVVFDVLHYVDHAAQEALMGRIHDALVPGGRLLLRIGDAADRRGFAISQWVDRGVTLLRGHRAMPMFGRSLVEWVTLLERIGFSVRSTPMSRGTPFANVLLVADRTH